MNEKLKQIGLSDAEADIYIAAIELGECLPTKLAERAGVKRSTLYEYLPTLIENGLLAETVRGKRKYLVAQDLQPYLEKRERDLEEAQELLPELRAILASSSVKPTILFYEGVEGIKKVYYDHLVTRAEILEIVGIENIHPELQTYIANYYIPERTRRKIPLKMLVSGPTHVEPFRVRSNSLEHREVKVLPKEVLMVPFGLNIYGDNVSITLHRKDTEMVGLIIRSKEIADGLRSIYSFLWSSARV